MAHKNKHVYICPVCGKVTYLFFSRINKYGKKSLKMCSDCYKKYLKAINRK